MNIQQAVKMAWKSIWGKKGRSALTMLGIIIGIAAVMTIVSAINGYTEKTMEQYEAMGSNKLTVNIWNYMYDEEGNSVGKDYFPALYDYCNSISEYVLGVTPQANCNATVVYGTKSSANMTWNYDDKGNLQQVVFSQGLAVGDPKYRQDYEIGFVDLMTAERFVDLFGENALLTAGWRLDESLCAWHRQNAKLGPGLPPKDLAVLLGVNWR